MKHIALGVNVGNLNRAKREPMLARCRRINRSLAQGGADLRVTGFFRHTGNLVLETSTVQPGEAARILSKADGATWTVVPDAMMRSAVEQIRRLPPPQRERGVRWTPGLVFAVTAPHGGTLSSSAKARLRSIDLTTVAAWKRDITSRGRLDSKRREGGWGAVSGAVARQTIAQWTARSLTTLEGVLDHPTPVSERRPRG